MENYNKLVSKILNNESLAKCVQELSDEKCLNLVTTDWISRLHNDATFQIFSRDPKSFWRPAYATENYRCETSIGPKLYAVLVGYCKFAKPFEGRLCKPGLIVLDSAPLTKMARALMSDLHVDNQISSDFKFNFNECGILGCVDCREQANAFSKNGYKVTRLNQPCILDTRVFDGKNVVNRFLSHMEYMFNQKFLAIMLLEIDSRYSYLNTKKRKVYRISGNVLHVVGFNEARLMASKKVDIGPLTNFECDNNVSKDEKPKISKDGFLDQLDNFLSEVEPKIHLSDDEMPKTKRKRMEDSTLENFTSEIEKQWKTDLPDDKMNQKRKRIEDSAEEDFFLI